MLYAVLALVLAAAALCFYLLSGKTLEGDSAGGATSRERVKMARKNSTRELDFEKVAAECKASGDEWKDGSFGHDGFGASIGDVELKESERGKKLELDSSGVTWQPPPNFCSTKRPLSKRSDGVPTWLYSDADGDGVSSAVESMKVDDIQQGSIGDCYFLAALATVVHHHPTITDDLIDETYEEQGIYGVSFHTGRQWQMVWVDGYFPCYRPAKSSHTGKYKLIFGKSADCKEIWPIVIEKAFAKLHGSYENIAGGQMEKALCALTGGEGGQCSAVNLGGQVWQKVKAKIEDDSYLVCAGSNQPDEVDPAGQKAAMQGVVNGHAYSVLHVYEGHDLRLLQLRNPWGVAHWKGAWSDGSREWDSKAGRAAQKEIAESLGHGTSGSVSGREAKDGRFWIGWSDFTENYRTVEWVHMNFTEEDMVRRAELLAEAARLVKRIHGGGGSGGGEDDGPKRTQESADAMFALLMAEEATKSRPKKKGNQKKKKGKK